MKASSLFAGVTIKDTAADDFDADSELPGINVYTASESWESKGVVLHTPFVTVSLTLSFEVWIEGTGAQADDLVEKIESVLFTNADFVKEFSGLRSASSQTTAKQDGNKPMLRVLQSYVLEYGLEFEPVIPDAFVTVEIEVDAIDPADPNTGNEGYAGGSPGPDGRIEGVVTVEPEQA
ncbi:MAG: hypothetical protein Q7S99_05330 [Parvibaculum sp.]|nr:hypothetical protein [Parvibaculum sp.]